MGTSNKIVLAEDRKTINSEDSDRLQTRSSSPEDGSRKNICSLVSTVLNSLNFLSSIVCPLMSASADARRSKRLISIDGTTLPAAANCAIHVSLLCPLSALSNMSRPGSTMEIPNEPSLKSFLATTQSNMHSLPFRPSPGLEK